MTSTDDKTKLTSMDSKSSESSGQQASPLSLLSIDSSDMERREALLGELQKMGQNLGMYDDHTTDEIEGHYLLLNISESKGFN